MSEIPAYQAREITDKHSQYSNELWWSNYKDGLFESIKNNALKGNNSTRIGNGSLECSENQRQYLISKLESLGYLVKYENNVLTISW